MRVQVQVFAPTEWRNVMYPVYIVYDFKNIHYTLNDLKSTAVTFIDAIQVSEREK